MTATGFALLSGGIGTALKSDEGASNERQAATQLLSDGESNSVRSEFALSPELIHMGALFISSHPRIVQNAIDRHRAALNSNPLGYLLENNRRLRRRVRDAAADYLGIGASDIALTDSTTMGIGIVYGGLLLDEQAEILSTDEDYYVTHEAIRRAGERTGARVRKISLFDHLNDASADDLVQRIIGAIRPATRVLALTWVHSGSGLKLPIRAISDELERVNAQRDPKKKVLLCLDGVHGFGCENAQLSDLGCDFLMAGCHKWLFGPRGTGIVAAHEKTWKEVAPTIPSFIDDEAWEAWLSGAEPDGPTTAETMTPGGFKAYEHQWALAEAFEFHQTLGRQRIAQRTHELASQLKEGLVGMPHVALRTPRSEALSAGIVSFDIKGVSPWSTVKRLRERKIIGSVTPYATRHVRLTPSIYNTSAEIDTVLAEIHALRG